MVMAEPRLQDVELNSQSVGVSTPSDAPAIITNFELTGGEDAREGEVLKENGLGLGALSGKHDDQILDDGSVRSDTDHSRSGSIAGDGRLSDLKPVKKFAVSKPVSFAKYSVPKVVATSSAVKTAVDKAPSASPTPTSATVLGRPRLVAKSTNSLQQKTSTFKPAAPDPMQVWNKNRVTPQPSTKHLTDEELKQQYGIHLTSRLQSDGDGKEAKWADIDDDDEDDWAPETIEWNDGTKTTVNPGDTPVAKQIVGGSSSGARSSQAQSSAPKQSTSQFSSTIGPNATVLKIGANAERQQLQKAAQQARGSHEKSASLSSRAGPAPTPVKSPWAKLPVIDKVSPVEINSQPFSNPSSRYPTDPVAPAVQNNIPQASSPAKEISADDFSRAWRDSPANQNRELFMPNSGRYETVPENRRRPSRNDQSFRAPAVLQRPGQADPRAPAEPSAAFQTHRTSIDQGRRRASSSISGGSGQIARRMSFKSNDTPMVNAESQWASQLDTTVPPATSIDPTSPTLTTTTYQARGDYLASQPGIASDTDIEAQRAAQKAAMRENIERARKRKIEEEQRLEAEKQERIRAKLASLGPAPPQRTAKSVESTDASQDQTASDGHVISSQSPPRPPQPLATGEPQQYGMMKVHPLDTMKETPVSNAGPPELINVPAESRVRNGSHPPTLIDDNLAGSQVSPDIFVDEDANPEPSPKFSTSAATTVPDARSGWTNVRNDPRQQQSNNLWGLPSNKALGNGTFDQSLAGYSPQGLSRTSSTGQPWLNGRTPTVGQSPQLHSAVSHVPETRSQLLQSMTSPSQQPLSLNSEVDSILSASRPVPIGPPPQTHIPQHGGINNVPNQSNNGSPGWNNFQNAARASDKSEAERYQREMNERRQEERRSGVRPQTQYHFNETFKHVQTGDQAGQRHITNVAQTSHLPNGMFGAVGTLTSTDPPTKAVNGQQARGSRFFPPTGPIGPQDRRSVTFSHIETPRTPSPPPAEEIQGRHPAYESINYRPIVHFPREKAVVRLPPPPQTTPAVSVAPVQVQEIQQSLPRTPMTWAARVSMPIPTPPIRVVSAPLVQSSSWQERFNGLLGVKPSVRMAQPAPALAITKEPLEVLSAIVASVSLPEQGLNLFALDSISSKNVEDEEDLFEDREAGSLPIVHLPRDLFSTTFSRISIPRSTHAAVEPTSVHMFMVSNWSERHAQQRPQYAIIRAPGANNKFVRKDLPSNGTEPTSLKPRNSTGHFSHKHPRGKPGPKTRLTVKSH